MINNGHQSNHLIGKPALLLAGAVGVVPCFAYAVVTPEQEAFDFWQRQTLTIRQQQLAQKQPSDFGEVTTTTTVEPTVLPLADTPVVQPPTPLQDCTPILKVKLLGLDWLSRISQNQLQTQVTQFNQYLKQCTSNQQLEDGLQGLVKQITQTFLQAGYVHIDISHKVTDIEAGQLTLQVTPATITQLDNQTSMATVTLFAGSPIDSVANIQTLDQALDQANRLPNRLVEADIYPQTDKQGIRILLSEQVDDNAPLNGLLFGFVSIDNFGQENTGNTRVQAQLGLANALGMAESISLYVSNAQKPALGASTHSPNHYNRSLSLNVQVPYGFWTLTALGSYASYRSELQRTNSIGYHGDSWQTAISVDRVFSRGQKHISNATLTLNHGEKSSRILGDEISTQSPTINFATLGVSHVQLFKHAALTTLATFNYGTSHLPKSGVNAANTAVNPASKQKFSYIDTQVNLTHYQKMGQLLPKFMQPNTAHQQDLLAFEHRLALRWTNDSLPAGQSFAINDKYAVRGGYGIGLAGDSGVYLQNTLSYVAVEGQNSKQDTRTKSAITVKPYIGFDIGRSINNSVNAQGHTTHEQSNVSAIIVGSKISWRDMLADIQLSKANFSSLNVVDKPLQAKATDLHIGASLTWHF